MGHSPMVSQEDRVVVNISWPEWVMYVTLEHCYFDHLPLLSVPHAGIMTLLKP